MIATLGFEFLYNRDSRPVPKLVIWVRPDTAPEQNILLFKMSEVSGDDENLRDVLRRLFRGFLEKFPNQLYSSTMHVQLDIHAPMGSEFVCKVVKQLNDCYPKNKKWPMQLETQMRFEGKVKARVTFFHHQQ